MGGAIYHIDFENYTIMLYKFLKYDRLIWIIIWAEQMYVLRVRNECHFMRFL